MFIALWFEGEVAKHVFFERGPCGFGGVQAADGTLDDAGVAGAVAVECADETNGAELVEAAAREAAAGVGRRGAGDPDGAEGVNQRAGNERVSRLPGIAEDGVVEN